MNNFINRASWVVLAFIGGSYAFAGINTTPVTSTIDQSVPGTTNKVYIGTDGTVTVGTALPAGTNLIGKAGVDQTTPGTTNGVAISHIGSTATAVGSGAANSGTQRMIIATDQPSIPVTMSPAAVSARSDTFTTAASGTTLNVSSTGLKYFSIQCKGTGAAPTAWNIVLEGSNDNVNFTSILTHTNTTISDGQAMYSGTNATPALYFRSRLVSVTLGSATNIICVIVGM